MRCIFYLADFYYQKSHRIIVCHITKNIAYHIAEVLIFYAVKLMMWAVPKICVYLILRFYSDHENRGNLMHKVLNTVQARETLNEMWSFVPRLPLQHAYCWWHYVFGFPCISPYMRAFFVKTIFQTAQGNAAKFGILGHIWTRMKWWNFAIRRSK